jgi:acyl carrier protein
VTSRSEIEAAVEAYVRSEGEVPADDPRFARDIDLFELGYIDSIAFVSLVSWLESLYEIELTEAYLFDERFNTITGIAAVVADRASTDGH